MNNNVIIEKIVEIDDTYFVKILYHEDNDIRRLYSLVGISNNEYTTICQSFNRDSFLLKVKQYVKLTNKIELLIASY